MTREAPGPETLQVILQLLEAGKTETVYRNLYLQRARTFFASLLPLGVASDSTLKSLSDIDRYIKVQTTLSRWCHAFYLN